MMFLYKPFTFCLTHYCFGSLATVSWDDGIPKVIQDALNVFYANFDFWIYLTMFSKKHIIEKFSNYPIKFHYFTRLRKHREL